MRRFFALSSLLILAGCTDPEGSRDVLEAGGYSDVQIVERPNWWSSNCGKEDSYTTHFTANGPTGLGVVGVVCSNGRYGKGATIRIVRVLRPLPMQGSR